jgi:hypothetical protein
MDLLGCSDTQNSMCHCQVKLEDIPKIRENPQNFNNGATQRVGGWQREANTE